MFGRRDELRVAALLLAGLLAVHQLRYALAFGEGAGEALAEHGHGYLAWVTPLIAAMTAVVFGRVRRRRQCPCSTGAAAR